MATDTEMQERLTYERNLNLKLREAQKANDDAQELHLIEISRLRKSLDQVLAINAGLEAANRKYQAALVEISRNRIHGKATVAAGIAADVLK